MPLTPTHLFMNWTPVTFTPVGGTVRNITKVTDCNFDSSADEEQFYGDMGIFPEMINAVANKRRARVTTGDAGAMLDVPPGTAGVLVATLNDSKNAGAVGGGGLLYTLSNATYLGATTTGPINKFSSLEMNFSAYAPDGATDPLVITTL